MQDNALQLLKYTVSVKLTSISSSIITESHPTDGTTTPVVLLQSRLFGGPGGTYFNDHNDNIAGIVGMRIRAGAQVDSIQVTYRLKDGNTYIAPMRGGTGGTEYSFTLADGEKLIRMEGMTSGVVLDMLTFYSNLNNTYGPYGITGLTPYSLAATEIIAFFGRYGSFNIMDAIGVYYTNN